MMRLLALLVMLAGLLILGVFGVAGIHDLASGQLRITAPSLTRQVKATPEEAAGMIEVKPFDPSSFQQIAARPLFFEGRRIPKPHVEPTRVPASPTPIPEPPPASSIDRLRLNGIHIGVHERRALVGAGDQTAHWCKEGDVVEGWTLVTIEPLQVHLRNGGQSATLQLYAAKSGD